MNPLSVATFRGRTSHRSVPPPHAGARLRLSVALHRHRLDQELAGGVDPGLSPRLGLRAAQLVEDRKRRQIARSLRSAVREAESPRAPFGSAVPVRRDTTATVRSAMLGLADRLEGPLPVSAEGVARTLALLTDGTGPLFHRDAPVSLADELWEIADTLAPASADGWLPTRLP
jgi:hypothetical protein